MRKVNLIYASGILAYIALIASVFSIATEVHIIPLGIFIMSLIAGLVIDRRQDPNPFIKPLILIFIVILVIIVSLMGISNENFFKRVFGIFLIIISAKLISPKKARDMLQLYLLNFFVVTGSAVTRLDLEFGLLVLGEAYISILGFILIYASRELEEISYTNIRKLASWSGIITLCLIPATIIIFLVIPRPTMTLFAWGAGTVTTTGFSDTVTPGAVEEIKLNNIPVFRVRWLGKERPQKILWRGIVYDTYNGGVWERINRREINEKIISSSAEEYEVIIEPTDTRYMFSAGIPLEVWSKAFKTSIVSGYTIEASRDINQRTLYRVYSALLSDIPTDLPTELYLGISDEMRTELAPMAMGLAKDSDLETAKAVESHLQKNFAYALSPGKPEGDPVLHFLKKNQKGHCEYFASAMVLILRSIGIPTRMVGGYLEGEWNDMGQYYLVRQSDAHTWVEVWIKDRGWVTFDPTPGAFLTGSTYSRNKFSRFIDYLRLKWYYWIIDYNINRQMDLARKTTSLIKSFRAGDRSIDLEKALPDMKYVMSFLAVIIIIIIFIFVIHYIKGLPRTWGERFISLFQKNGYKKQPGQTLYEFASEIPKDNNELKRGALSFVEKYYQFEYGMKGDERELERLLIKIEGYLKKAA